MDPPGWRAIQCVRSYTAPSTETQVSSSASCSATCAGVKDAAEGAPPRAVIFAPPTRGAAKGVFCCFRDTAGIFFICRSTPARACERRTGLGRLGVVGRRCGSSAAVPRPGTGVFAEVGRPRSASRGPFVRERRPRRSPRLRPGGSESDRPHDEETPSSSTSSRIVRAGRARSLQEFGGARRRVRTLEVPFRSVKRRKLCLRACPPARVGLEARAKSRRRVSQTNRHRAFPGLEYSTSQKVLTRCRFPCFVFG